MLLRHTRKLKMFLGFAIGGLFSLMTTSFQYEDPVLREQMAGGRAQKVSVVAKDMAKGVYAQGKMFAKMGALYSAIECCIEGVRVHTQYSLARTHLISIAQKTTSTTQRRRDSSLVVYYPTVQGRKARSMAVLPLLDSLARSTCICEKNLTSTSYASIYFLSLELTPTQ